MKVIAVWNLQGGSGKTTLVKKLALYFREVRFQYSILDLDPYMRNDFRGLIVSDQIDSNCRYQLIDNPPALTDNVLDYLQKSQLVVVPYRTNNELNYSLVRLKGLIAESCIYPFHLNDTNSEAKLLVQIITDINGR